VIVGVGVNDGVTDGVTVGVTEGDGVGTTNSVKSSKKLIVFPLLK
jgi:hypothetical protein